MKADIDRLAERLAYDARVTDYDFWRGLRDIEDALFRLRKTGRPIPIGMLYARRVMRAARRKRGADRS